MIMATATTNLSGVAMSMEPPYGVYLNGELLAEYQVEAEADARYRTLLNRATPPATLTARYADYEKAQFELIQAGHTAQLWKSAIRRQLTADTWRDVIRFHVTKGDKLEAIFIEDAATAHACFDRVQRGATAVAGGA